MIVSTTVSTRTIAAGEFKQKCLRLLDEVGETGDPIVVTKRGKPVAQINPVKPEKPNDWFGSMADETRILGDLVAPVEDVGVEEMLREWDELNE